MTRLPHTRRSKHRRGATAVEFAMVLPIFMLVLLFCFETWHFMQCRQAVDQAALETGRAAIVPGATAADARQRGRRILDAVGAHTATITITPAAIDESTDEVTVAVALPYADVGVLYKYFAINSVCTSTLTIATENKRIGRL